MNTKWSKIRFGDILRRVERFEKRDELKEYVFAGTYSFSRGIFVGERKAGSSFALPKVQHIKKGDFVYCKIMAWEGAFGLVPEEADGCVMSNAFVVYEVNRSLIEPKYLDFFFKIPRHWKRIGGQSSGTNVRRQSLHPATFEKEEIDLPILEEQHRIVARIEQMAAKVEEASRLRKQATQEAEALVHSAMKEVLTNVGKKPSWKLGPIGAFAEINPTRAGNVSLSPADPVSFVPMKAVDDITGTIAWPEARPYAEVSKGYTWFEDGDVIFARITPCMQNGKAAIAHNLVNGVGFGSTEFHVIRPGPQITAEWMHAIVRHRAFRDDAAAHFKGTAGQQRVPESFLEQKEIPVPPLPEQHQIITYINGLTARIAALMGLQDATATELDAMLPSILDRAFKGEL